MHVCKEDWKEWVGSRPYGGEDSKGKLKVQRCSCPAEMQLQTLAGERGAGAGAPARGFALKPFLYFSLQHNFIPWESFCLAFKKIPTQGSKKKKIKKRNTVKQNYSL